MNDTKIHYEPHPVRPERKAKLRAKGLTIIDAIYMPGDYTKSASDAPLELPAMSKAELQAALDAKGVDHKPAMSKAELQALLDGAA